MSLVWSSINYFVYTEMLIVFALVLPIVRPIKWHAFFKSRYLCLFASQANKYFILMLSMLLVLLSDALLEIKKFSSELRASPNIFNIEYKIKERLFQAQCNLFMSGYAIFLILVVRRLVQLINAQAELIINNWLYLQEVKYARMRMRCMRLRQELKKQNSIRLMKSAKNELTDLDKHIAELKDCLTYEDVDKKTLKTHIDHFTGEYARLTTEFGKLEERYIDSYAGLGETDKNLKVA